MTPEQRPQTACWGQAGAKWGASVGQVRGKSGASPATGFWRYQSDRPLTKWHRSIDPKQHFRGAKQSRAEHSRAEQSRARGKPGASPGQVRGKSGASPATGFWRLQSDRLAPAEPGASPGQVRGKSGASPGQVRPPDFGGYSPTAP
jgi:hypothetical protein